MSDTLPGMSTDIKSMLAQLAAKDAEIAALTKQRDDWIDDANLGRIREAELRAEIAALKIALGQIANKCGSTEISHSDLQDVYSEMRRIAKDALKSRAALEMSGGVK